MPVILGDLLLPTLAAVEILAGSSRSGGISTVYRFFTTFFFWSGLKKPSPVLVK